MSVAFTNLSWWLWSGKHQEPRIPNGSSINSSGDLSMWESDVLRFPLVRANPHGSDFPSDDETDNSFAVLVPCYGRGYGRLEEEDPKGNLLSGVQNFPDSYSDESKKYVENWLSSLRNT
ncbi:hypothetical protein SESBI_17382 [Sesbania bispinosa]|nr:hypothetical protein SESBI_17382 [Sesbania bispinosa]